MSDHGFDSRLHSLFAQAPGFPDAPVFAARVQGRLDRGWALRRVFITTAGIAGGGVAAAQFMSAHLLSQVDSASRAGKVESGRAIATALSHLPTASLHALPFGGEVVWLVAGLVVMAGALLATRVFEDF
ncbi:MAG: hypothetical protein ACYDD1_07385 [Caulobacteraceae bacterium]